MSKLEKIILLFALAMVALIVFFSLRIQSPERQVKAEIAKIRASGEPVSMQDLMPQKITDAENAAVVYNKIFKLMQSPDAARDESVFADFFSSSKRQANPILWDTARKSVDRYRNVIPIVSEAVARPYCVFRAEPSDNPFQETPYFSNLRQLNRILCASAIINAKDGRIDRALHHIEMGFRMSESLKDEPTKNGQLTRLSIIAIAAHALDAISDNESINLEQAKHLYDVLANINLRPGLLQALEGERVTGIAFYDGFINQIKGPKFRLGSLSSAIWKLQLNKYYNEELYYLRYMSVSVKAAHIPYRQLEKSNLKMPEEPKDIFLFADVVIPILGGMFWKCDQGMAIIGGSRIILALKVYKSKYRSYPESLAECTEKTGWSLPKDPFAAKEFTYRRQGQGFLLYSIGPNLKDDGGKRYKNSSENIKNGDIVWNIER